MSALQPLIPRLAAKELEALAIHLDTTAAPFKPDTGLISWEPYFELTGAVKDRGTKAKPRSALKRLASATRPKAQK